MASAHNDEEATGVTPSNAVLVETVIRWSGLDAHRAEWSDLEDAVQGSTHIYQRWCFVHLWWQCYHASSAPYVVLVREHDRLMAVAPFALRRRHGMTVLEVMGGPIAQISDVIVDPVASDDVRAALRAQIAAAPADLLDFRNIRDGNHLLELLPEGVVLVEQCEAPFADLARRGSPHSEAYSSRQRSDYRRRLRRLQESGVPEFGWVGGSAEAADVALEAITLKRSDSRLPPSSPVRDPRFAEFFAAAVADADLGAHVSWIRLDGELIGADLCFDYRQQTFGHVLATSPRRRSHSLGRVLVGHALAAAHDRGSIRFDMGVPADDFKLVHCDGVVGSRRALVAQSWRGRLWLVVRRWAHRIRPMR